jgi:lipopolysaccharide transport system permease protein
MTREPQRIVITPPSRISLPNPRHLWEAREVLLRFGARDVTLRYRQTALGIVWVVLQPLLGAGIFSVVFGGIAKLPSGNTPYFVFTFAGLLAWNLFSNIVSRASSSLISNSALVSKVFFPRILVPLAVVYSALVDFVVSLGMMIVLLLIYQINPGWSALLLPIWTLLAILFACGIGLIASSLMVSYRDVSYVIPVALQMLLYATPIAYSIAAVPHRYLVFFEVNPLTWMIEEFRWSLLRQAAPKPLYIVLSFVVSVAIFLLGAVLFESRERTFADVI